MIIILLKVVAYQDIFLMEKSTTYISELASLKVWLKKLQIKVAFFSVTS